MTSANSYRISVPAGTDVAAYLAGWAKVVNVYPAGSSLPNDWPSNDTDSTRARADFTTSAATSIPIDSTVYVWAWNSTGPPPFM